jgi:hypothetical protein
MHDDGEHVERIFHIEALKGELEELAGGNFTLEKVDDALPPELEEQFLEQILAFERAEQVTHRERLERAGVALPPVDTLDDDALPLKLIEVVHTLAEMRIYLENTNHLSDRQLYTYLLAEALNESGPLLPPDMPMNCHLDICGSGSEDDIAIWLRYYADDETRAQWATDFPDMTVPPHEPPPFDRDRHLPRPAPPENPFENPEVADAWCLECREKLLRRLERDAVAHGAVSDWPLWYAPPIAAIWTVAAPDGAPGWWAISGDVPTAWLPVEGLPDPRSFADALSRRWLAALEAVERGDAGDPSIHADLTNPRIAANLRGRAEMLADWAAMDEPWEEDEA